MIRSCRFHSPSSPRLLVLRDRILPVLLFLVTCLSLIIIERRKCGHPPTLKPSKSGVGYPVKGGTNLCTLSGVSDEARDTAMHGNLVEEGSREGRPITTVNHHALLRECKDEEHTGGGDGAWGTSWPILV